MDKKISNHSQKNSNFKKGEIVICYNKVLKDQCKGKIINFKHENSKIFALIKFIGQDSRLNDWYPIDELEHITINRSKKIKKKKTRRNSSDDSDDDNAFSASSQSSNENELSSTSEFSMDSEAEVDTIANEEEDSDFIEFEKVHKEITKKRNIESITLGKHTIRTWYYSPYPCPFHDCQRLYICEQCFKYFHSKEDLDKHIQSTKEFQPYGREIYRNNEISIFEMKGDCQKIPCQCLCLLGKLFLDHKVLYYDTEGFSFYVLCEMDEKGYHSLGFSSREVNTDENNVLSCIVIFPPFQKKGYGKLLISLSYEIARRKRAPGGPEKPLSDLGQKSFESFWKEQIVRVLKDHPYLSNIELIVDATGISEDDIKDMFEKYGFAKFIHGNISKVVINKDKLKRAIDEIKKKKAKIVFDPRMLLWKPDDDFLSY